VQSDWADLVFVGFLACFFGFLVGRASVNSITIVETRDESDWWKNGDEPPEYS